MEEKSLKELKDKYNKLKSKYNLPEFTELNKLFDIEDIEVETEFLLKKTRRKILEKIIDYLRFLDLILNPSNAPIFFFRLIKKLEKEDRDVIINIYEKLGNFEVSSISLDLNYSEEKEAEFIKEIFKVFNQEIKKDFLRVIEKLNFSEENFKKINGSYFG